MKNSVSEPQLPIEEYNASPVQRLRDTNPGNIAQLIRWNKPSFLNQVTSLFNSVNDYVTRSVDESTILFKDPSNELYQGLDSLKGGYQRPSNPEATVDPSVGKRLEDIAAQGTVGMITYEPVSGVDNAEPSLGETLYEPKKGVVFPQNLAAVSNASWFITQPMLREGLESHVRELSEENTYSTQTDTFTTPAKSVTTAYGGDSLPTSEVVLKAVHETY